MLYDDDPVVQRRQAYNRLAAQRDPLLREIGEQLRRGDVRPHELLREPAYRRVIERGLQHLRTLNARNLKPDGAGTGRAP